VIAWWLPTMSRALSVIVWSIRSIDPALLIATDAAASFCNCRARRRCHSACLRSCCVFLNSSTNTPTFVRSTSGMIGVRM
jgi:hypothetical protein